jgi:tetraacyldisaccharide 4'-kinase
MFDLGILRQDEFPVPTVVIGNISVGGTGKTPHLIHLAKKLQAHYSIAILSRGYLRKSKGFRYVLEDDNPRLSGDEPLEIKNHLPDVIVATDGNRRRGISRILKEVKPRPELILLDDGFQHRWIKPAFSLVLTRADHLFTEDTILPSGSLRESKKEIRRAHAVCVTGCTPDIDIVRIKQAIQKFAKQKIFFSKIIYRKPEGHIRQDVLLLSSIAKPESMLKYLQDKYQYVDHLQFPDHHQYTNADIRKILSNFMRLSNERVIITSGKDWVKLKQFKELENYPIECLDIGISLLEKGEEELINQIQNYVEQYSRNY